MVTVGELKQRRTGQVPSAACVNCSLVFVSTFFSVEVEQRPSKRSFPYVCLGIECAGVDM